MSKMITWATPQYSASPLSDETDSLFFADNVIRYRRFTSPVSIKFCIAESLRYVVDRQKITIPPGSFFVANEGLEMECLPNKPGVKGMFVSFTRALFQDVCRNQTATEQKLLDDPGLEVSLPRFFQHIFKSPSPLSRQMLILSKQMADSGLSNYSLPPDVFYSMAENLLLFDGEISRQMGQLNARTASTREELFRRVLYAKEYMEDNRHSDLNLDEIARRACLSPYHFHRSFREAFGHAPMKWFRQLKLEKAKEMLADKQMTVTQVAMACGFADVFSFSKAFKRKWGVNPSKFQN